MRTTRTLLLLVSLLALAGCYQATINTGRHPNGEVIKNQWAHSFLAGLVPPSTVDAASKCPDGVAMVQTQHSFLNMVATIVTSAIYSPMTITVQCAGERTGMAPRDEAKTVAVPAGASASEKAAAVKRAAELSRSSGGPAYLLFE